MDKRMLAPGEIIDYTISTGVKKAEGSTIHTFIFGILSGAFIALGGFAASIASHSIENPGLSRFVAGAVFPVGLMFVLICGGELFTGNTLLTPALADRKISLKGMLRNWVIVYFSNFIGAFIIAALIFWSGTLLFNSGSPGGYAIKVASTKGSLSFWTAFTSGILCNFIVCLGVWGSYSAKDIGGKVLIIWFPIMAFVVAGFEHSVANMYYFSIGMLAKSQQIFVEASHLSPEKLMVVDVFHAVKNLIPVTLGNIVGGGVLVGLAYWAALKHHKEGNSTNKNRRIAG